MLWSMSQFPNGETVAPDRPRVVPLVHPASMFVSAAIFAFFGFVYLRGTPLTLQYHLFVWTIRGAAIGFTISGLLASVLPAIGSSLYAAISALAAAAFLILGAWLLIASGGRDVNGYLLLFFAVWNGSGTVQAFLAGRRRG